MDDSIVFFILGLLCPACWALPVLGLLNYMGIRHLQARAELARAMFVRWAEEQGFEVIETRWNLFFGYLGKQMRLRVQVRDSNGRRRTGLARCGSIVLGLNVERVEVTWDATPAPEPETPAQPEANPRDDPMWDRWADE